MHGPLEAHLYDTCESLAVEDWTINWLPPQFHGPLFLDHNLSTTESDWTHDAQRHTLALTDLL